MRVLREGLQTGERWEVSRRKYLVWQPSVGDRTRDGGRMCVEGGGVEQMGSIRKHLWIPGDLVLLPIQFTVRKRPWSGVGATIDEEGHLSGLVYASGKQRSKLQALLLHLPVSPEQRNYTQDLLTAERFYANVFSTYMLTCRPPHLATALPSACDSTSTLQRTTVPKGSLVSLAVSPCSW